MKCFLFQVGKFLWNLTGPSENLLTSFICTVTGAEKASAIMHITTHPVLKSGRFNWTRKYLVKPIIQLIH